MFYDHELDRVLTRRNPRIDKILNFINIMINNRLGFIPMIDADNISRGTKMESPMTGRASVAWMMNSQ